MGFVIFYDRTQDQKVEFERGLLGQREAKTGETMRRNPYRTRHLLSFT